MIFTSTRDHTIKTPFREAVFQGLATDGGLYIPESYPTLANIHATISQSHSITQLGQAILSPYINDIPAVDLQQIIKKALNFPIPLIHLEGDIYLLEVFHGPTLAFKDVGARFMASTLAYFLTDEKQHLTIVVATSGDTGSAIANAFYHMPNIDVYILYPSGKITALQEQQITTFGDNIHALEIEGTFDDCQRLVKTSLLDPELRKNRLITTANSINISRLLPQIIYHAWGLYQYYQLGLTTTPILSVPSGNFGNLTSAIYAKQLGFPIQHLIAATNSNAIVPDYLTTHHFTPKPSHHTLANAMDVGNPSNFERLTSFYNNNIDAMRHEITGVAVSDEQILTEIRDTYKRTGYLLDPHTAVGVAAARQTKSKPVIVTATAHPAKFPEAIKLAIGKEADMPERLKIVLSRPKQAQMISADYEMLRKQMAEIA